MNVQVRIMEILLLLLGVFWNLGLFSTSKWAQSRWWDWGVIILGIFLILNAIEKDYFGFAAGAFVLVFAVLVLIERAEERKKRRAA